MKNRIAFVILVALILSFGNYQNATSDTFGNPVYSSKVSGCDYGSTTCYAAGSYHAGIDYRSNVSLDVIAVNSGKIARIEYINFSDHGMGNNVIIEHRLLNGISLYSTYSHLATIETGLFVGKMVAKGEKIGTIGGSGYGAQNYWDAHLHYEMKTKPVTNNSAGGTPCNNGTTLCWGYMPSNPDNYGYVNPNNYFGTVEVQNPNIVGHYQNGFHSDGTSQAFVDAFNQNNPKIGWPFDNGGTAYVHEIFGQYSSSFSVIAQDFQGDMNAEHFGTDGKSMLILNDLDSPKKCFPLAEGFYGWYKTNDGAYRLGVAFTYPIARSYATSPQSQTGDPIQAGDCITVQKFKRRLATGAYYNNERKTLVWKEGIAVQQFGVGEFSIDPSSCSGTCPQTGDQIYVTVDSNPANDKPWPKAGQKVPTGIWYTKPGTYNFVLHNADGSRKQGWGLTAQITEGNHQFAGDVGEPTPTPVPTPAPASPQVTLSVATISDSSLQLSWTANFDSADYSFIRFYRDGLVLTDLGLPIQIDPQSTAYADTGLGGGRSYCYEAEYVKASGQTVRSNQVCIATTLNGVVVEVPAVPNLHIASVDYSQAVTAWGAVLAADRYHVRRVNPASSVWTTYETSFTDNGIAPGGHYCYMVSACKVGACSQELEVCADTPAVGAFAASFIADKTAGTAPLTVNFTNTSTGAPTDIGWIVDNGGFIYSWDLTRTFTVPGTHVVVLHTYRSPDYRGQFSMTIMVEDPVATPTPTPVPTPIPTPVPTPTPLPTPWQITDIGAPTTVGTVSYDGSQGSFELKGSGNDLWGDGGQYTLLHQELIGDGEIIARVLSQTNTSGWAKAGVIITAGTSTTAGYALMALTPENGYAFQHSYFSHTGGGSYAFPNAWLKLSRIGNQIKGYQSADGYNWTLVGSATLSLPGNARFGLFVASHDGAKVGTAKFDNITTFQYAKGLPDSWQAGDIGPVGIAGMTEYDYFTQSWIVSGTGWDIWGTCEQFHYAFRPLKGDGEIVGRAIALDSVQPYAKAGIMIKEAAQPGSRCILLAVKPEGFITFEHDFWNSAYGGSYSFPNAWLKLSRTGNVFTAYVSNNGADWTSVGSAMLPMPAEVIAGFFITPHIGDIPGAVEIKNGAVIEKWAD